MSNVFNIKLIIILKIGSLKLAYDESDDFYVRFVRSVQNDVAVV